MGACMLMRPCEQRHVDQHLQNAGLDHCKLRKEPVLSRMVPKKTKSCPYEKAVARGVQPNKQQYVEQEEQEALQEEHHAEALVSEVDVQHPQASSLLCYSP